MKKASERDDERVEFGKEEDEDEKEDEAGLSERM